MRETFLDQFYRNVINQIKSITQKFVFGSAAFSQKLRVRRLPLSLCYLKPKICGYSNMSSSEINKNEVDIVIGALNADLTQFLNSWRPFFSGFHLIIVKDPELKEELNIPEGFDLDIYSKTDMEKVVGAANTTMFSGYSCRYFGYLISKKKYIVSIDDDCVPAKDPKGVLVDAVSQHVNNLENPATPLFFNTLYDPYCEGADFVRGYPFSLRSGVPCAASCGLWLNLADLDAPTQALKTEQRNTSYVDAVMTVPLKAMLPISGINIAFNRELVGPALVPALRIAGEGRVRWETLEDVWCGMCLKHISDHLGYGVKTGLPYVWRNERGDAVESLRKKWEGMKLMEKSVPFFESLKLPESAVKVEDCVVELAKAVKEQLGSDDPAFTQAADAMVKWVQLWNSVNSSE